MALSPVERAFFEVTFRVQSEYMCRAHKCHTFEMKYAIRFISEMSPLNPDILLQNINA